MKHLIATAVALSFGMAGANASDLYQMKVEFLQGDKRLATYSADVPMGVQSNFAGTQTRETTTAVDYFEGKKVGEFREPLQTGFTFNGRPILDDKGELRFYYDYKYARTESMGTVVDDSTTLGPITREIVSSGATMLKLGEMTTLVTSGGNPSYQLRVSVTKI